MATRNNLQSGDKRQSKYSVSNDLRSFFVDSIKGDGNPDDYYVVYGRS